MLGVAPDRMLMKYDCKCTFGAIGIAFDDFKTR